MSESLAMLRYRRENLAKQILSIESELGASQMTAWKRRQLEFRLDIQKRALADVNRQITRRGEMIG